MPDAETIKLISGLGAGGLLTLIVLALANEWVYTRGRFKEMKADRDMWRRIALREKHVLGKADDVLGSPEE